MTAGCDTMLTKKDLTVFCRSQDTKSVCINHATKGTNKDKTVFCTTAGRDISPRELHYDKPVNTHVHIVNDQTN